MNRHRIFLLLGLVPALASGLQVAAGKGSAWPTLDEAIASPRDLFAEAALRRPDGAEYETFAAAMPPPRYVHADFREYPLVLSAPNAPVKARLISNGSGINRRGGSRSWQDPGTPVVFRVGTDEFLFGGLADRTSEPAPADGWMPIYTIDYRHPSPILAEGAVPIDQPAVQSAEETYRLEAFASTLPEDAALGLVYVRFTLVRGRAGAISLELEPRGGAFDATTRVLRSSEGQPVVTLGPGWRWERSAARGSLSPGKILEAAIVTSPGKDGTIPDCTPEVVRAKRQAAVGTWTGLRNAGMTLRVSEDRINHAWANLLCQNAFLENSDRLLYSAGNQYAALYSTEGNDASQAMLAWGHAEAFGRQLPALLRFTRKGLENHQAGNKLLHVARYYWLTGDADRIRAVRPLWEPELRRLMDGRTEPNGLYPREQYAGDIRTPVYSLPVAAKAWRALHDLTPVLRQLGETALAGRVADNAAAFKPILDRAVAAGWKRETTPPFLPMALEAGEAVHSPITASRIGSYWNLMNGFVMGSRLFSPGSAESVHLPRYLEQHGGLFMGMLRSGGTAHGFWTGADRVNPLYGLRYVQDLLLRDEPDRAVVSLYGMLAQGMTRQTLIGGEGCTLRPVDARGRFFYCPPNSAANGYLLSLLRGLVVQDPDLDGDGVPETLRFLFATPRRWLEPGKELLLERAPTAFGPVSIRLQVLMPERRVSGEVTLPKRKVPDRTVLRLRLPTRWRLAEMATLQTADGRTEPRAVSRNETVDLTGLQGSVRLEVPFRTR